MASTQINPAPTPVLNSPPGDVPELHLLLARDMFEEPLWKSLLHQIDDFFFPKKLPPLKLESKPEPVKDIWGFYNYKKNGALGSTAVHIMIAGLVVGATMLGHRMIAATPLPKATVVLVDPGDLPAIPQGKTRIGGGGGGGDRDVLQATKGRLPKFSMQQITPPLVVVRNEHPKLEVPPTIVIPPDIKLASNKLPNLGDPMSGAVVPSNGTGYGGGIGNGSGGGIGSGKGPGFGPGEGGGTGGGIFHMGDGATPPRTIHEVEPEFSEEARKAKYSGVCTLMLVVDTNGMPTNIRVVSSLGMGLDEKAIEAAKQWRFTPATKDGRPVPFELALEVDFHLY